MVAKVEDAILPFIIIGTITTFVIVIIGIIAMAAGLHEPWWQR